MNEVFKAVLNVLAIIALVAVAVFLIVLLTDLLLSVIDGKNGIFFKRDKKEQVKTLELEDDLEDTPKQIEQKSSVQEQSNVNLELAESERLALLGEKEALASQNEDLKQRIEALEAKNEEQVEEESQPTELTDEELDRMYAELIADLNKDDESEELETSVEDDLSLDLPEEEEENSESEQEVVEEQPIEEPMFEETSEETEQEIVEDNTSILEEEIAKLKELLEQSNQEKQDLEKQLQERPEIQAVEADSYTLEDLLNQKQELEERLKVANKELKANKKEYIPLARIKKTLENDEAKLRRREAIVAKKKIVLFGVTNYVVDPEKEKELSEDLDQLEALSLSVQHCEEVMTENKDRYPLLENTNKILVNTVAHIKADIEAVNQKINALQSKGTDNGTDDANGDNE